MKSKRFMIILAAIGLCVSAAASAQEAFTTRSANVRAGPERDYPLVATLAPGTPVNVVGCIDGYNWCDVVAYDIRGWVSARSLQFAYEGRRVGVLEYGPTIGLPLIGFSLGYWDSYYRNRPFYRDRPRWERRWNDSPRFNPGYNGPRVENRPQFREQPRVDRNYRQDRPQVAQPQYQQPQRQRPQGQPPAVSQAAPQQPQAQRSRPEQQQRLSLPPQGSPNRIDRTPVNRDPGGN